MLTFVQENSLVILLSAGTGFTFWWLWRQRGKLRIKWYAALILALIHTLVGVACVKIFAVLETFDFSSFGGMSLFGAIFFLPLAYFVGAKLTKRRVSEVFDVFTPCVVFTLLCARVNCLFSGCCLGQRIPGSDMLRWPTRELEIVFYIALLTWLILKERKGYVTGIFYPAYMFAYGLVRFVLEFFRESSSPIIFHLSHIWAAVTLCLGLSIYAEISRKAKKRKS